MTSTVVARSDNDMQVISKGLFKRIRTWWLILALLLLGCENSLFTVDHSQGKSLINVAKYYDVSSPFLALSTLTIYLIVAGLLFGNVRSTIIGMTRQKALLYLGLFSLFSTAWSQEPFYSFKQAVYLSLLLALSWYFTSTHTLEEQIAIVLSVGLVIAIASAAMAVFLPHYGCDLSGAWKGIFAQKNHLGHGMLFLLSGVLFRENRRLSIFWIMAGGFGFGVLLMSRSVGSLILAITLIVVRVYGPRLQKLRPERTPFLLFIAVCGILLITAGWSLALALVGKDSTLTGRTEEWSVLIPFAMQHFWLGYGYAAFWNGSGDSLQAMKLVGGAMRGADSGYLDTFLQVGFIGLALVCSQLIGGTIAFRRLLASERVPLAVYWYFGLLLITFMGSFTDGFISAPVSAPAFLFFTACAGLYKLNCPVSWRPS